MYKIYPRWFWWSIIAFSMGELITIPLLVASTDHARDVLSGLIIIGLVIYPIFFVTVFITLIKKVKLEEHQKFWAIWLLFVPVLFIIPIFISAGVL